jgi:hypothetical protein
LFPRNPHGFKATKLVSRESDPSVRHD